MTVFVILQKNYVQKRRKYYYNITASMTLCNEGLTVIVVNIGSWSI